MEEEHDNPTDSNESVPETDAANEELSNDFPDDDSQEEKAFIEFRNSLQEEYKLRAFYMDLINEQSKRRINWAMLLTQFFGRYSKVEAICFLGIAAVLLTIQFLTYFFGWSSALVLITGVLMTALMFWFAFVAVNYFLSALYDIRLLKRGYCSLGYQHVRPEVAESTPDNSYPSSIMVAYKDKFGMIHTKDIPTKQQRMFFMPPVLMVFADVANSDKITFLEAVPREIQYDKSRQMFTQEWKCALYALVPIAMIILYSISFRLSCIANMSLHQ